MNMQDNDGNIHSSNNLYECIQNTIHSQIEALQNAKPRERIAIIQEVDSWLFRELDEVRIIAISGEELQLILKSKKEQGGLDQKIDSCDEDVPF